MRSVAVLLLVGAASVARGDEVRYHDAGQPYDYAVVSAPVPAAVLGGLMLDAAARLRSLPTVLPGVSSSPSADAPAVTQAALAWRSGRPPEPPAGERVAVLRAKRTFRVGAEASRLKLLRLRVRYQDGLVVSLNGQEVARRYVDEAASPLAFSPRSRGNEWEIIPLPLSPGLLRAGENVISFEVRPSSARPSPTLDFELSGADALRLARGPLVQRVTQTSATLVFETDLPTRAELRYGRTGDQLRARAGTTALPSTRHVVQLSGLTPGSRVFYRVVLEGVPLPVRSFATAPRAGEPLRFAVFGDVRSGHEVHGRIVRALVDEAPDFVLSTGDAVYAGHDEGDWQRFFAVAEELLALVPLYPVCGNHDLGASPAGLRTFEDIFALWPGPARRPARGAWYAFDVADLHFVMLDSNRYGDPEQLAWLEEDLASVRGKARAVFVATHHGPWSRGPHGGHPEALAWYVPVLEKAQVAALFSGHDHLYQRGRVGNLRYVVSGGGGAPLYPVRCGVRGRPACGEEDGAEATHSEYHYLLVEVYRDHARLCPKRPDGTPLEACVSFSWSDASWRGDGGATGRASRARRSPSAAP
jgi:hypothetical protein